MHLHVLIAPGTTACSVPSTRQRILTQSPSALTTSSLTPHNLGAPPTEFMIDEIQATPPI
jgi:hypothetical protein